MIGKTISHYKILEKLGEGGMGVVYKAEDTKLERTVALKFLAPRAVGGDEEQSRLIREAKSTAALNHPNICTIYEIDKAEGRTFIAMECVEGQTLKDKIESGPLTLDEAMDIAIQVARGLLWAHTKGIIHRDIKPANIMLTSEGQAKIMDFGLAKPLGSTLLTKAGTVIGTIAYISPEQARGAEVDSRTDIWSLGALLYEMVTGQRPFKGDYEQAVIYLILNEEPEPLRKLRSEAPHELGRIIGKALSKKLEERYQRVGELEQDLESVRNRLTSGALGEIAPAEEQRPSIAVLPFVDMSPDKDQEYFCDGMAEELINAMAQVDGLRVVARTAAFQFRGKGQDIREIGEKLNVQSVLQGSVRKAGDCLRITVQLVNVSDSYHLWSEKYDRNLDDVFAIQDEISLAVVEKLKVGLLAKDRAKLTKRSTEDQEAYNLYLKGRYHWNKRTEEGLKKGLDCFQMAIEKDPAYAAAYAGLSDSYRSLAGWGLLSPTEATPKALAAAQKALEIDDTLAEAHASMALIKADYYWDFSGSENELKRAIELNPAYATAHHWYGMLLAHFGRLDEALVEIMRAQELEPLSLIINLNVGFIYRRSRRYDQAIEQFHKTIEMDSNFRPAHAHLGVSYVYKGMFKQAIAEAESAVTGQGEEPELVAYLGLVYALAGKRKKARDMLAKLKKRSGRRYVPPCFSAMIHAGLGDVDRTIEWLDKAFKERDYYLWSWLPERWLEPVRTDPRFDELLKKAGWSSGRQNQPR